MTFNSLPSPQSEIGLVSQRSISSSPRRSSPDRLDRLEEDRLKDNIQARAATDDTDESDIPLVSLLIPAYNEAAILENNLQVLCDYMQHLEGYRWEVVLVNDGSRDDTATLADAFASRHPNINVVHHFVNLGLGQALRTGFEHCQGDYVVTLDLDLSYAPEHIERLLTKIRQTRAKVVVTSPYMKGGKVSNVPELRRLLSIWANRFLSVAAKRNVATLTGMVRVYDAKFLDSVNLRSSGMEVNPEVIHKAMLMQERIEEIPAHLSWRQTALQSAVAQSARAARLSEPPAPKADRRKSSMKILRHTWAIFYYGFVFRPVMFFIIPSLFFLLLALYSIAWVFIHSWNSYQQLAQANPFPDPTEAVAIAFQQAPHTFVIGGMMLMLAIQLFSLGILAMQSKRYFEEIYYLGSSIYRDQARRDRE